MNRIIILFLILITINQIVYAEPPPTNIDILFEQVVNPFIIEYQQEYFDLVRNYEHRDFKDKKGRDIFFLYQNREIHTKVIFLNDGIVLTYRPQKDYPTPKPNEYEIQLKSIAEYINTNLISFSTREEGNFSLVGDHRLRYKYVSSDYKKYQEIRFVYGNYLYNKPDDELFAYARDLANFDFEQDKWIVESLILEQVQEERYTPFYHSVVVLFFFLILGKLVVWREKFREGLKRLGLKGGVSFLEAPLSKYNVGAIVGYFIVMSPISVLEINKVTILLWMNLGASFLAGFRVSLGYREDYEENK